MSNARGIFISIAEELGEGKKEVGELEERWREIGGRYIKTEGWGVCEINREVKVKARKLEERKERRGREEREETKHRENFGVRVVCRCSEYDVPRPFFAPF